MRDMLDKEDQAGIASSLQLGWADKSPHHKYQDEILALRCYIGHHQRDRGAWRGQESNDQGIGVRISITKYDQARDGPEDKS